MSCKKEGGYSVLLKTKGILPMSHFADGGFYVHLFTVHWSDSARFAPTTSFYDYIIV